MKIVTMNDEGRITVPADARRALGIDGPADFEIEIDDSSDAIILRPVVTIRREDAWAYTPEHMARVAAARADGRDGRSRAATADEVRSGMSGE
jgi:bifunctional DNA-binding transcriptional regulator/antitoxin component of YhaV-PrlF toxin-antitoxin module